MAGLSLKVGGFGGVGSTASAPSYGTDQSFNTVTQAAFGPGVSAQAATPGDILTPNDGFGVALWAGIAAVVLLVCIRTSLPK
jgi:hypothetical protein